MSIELTTYNSLYNQQERKELIGKTLKSFRELRKLSQREVAEAIEINTQSYATYERGRNEAPAEVLVRLAMFFEVPLDMLMQRHNMQKDMVAASKQLDDMSQDIADLSKALGEKDMDEEEKKKLFEALGALSELTEVIKQFNKQ